ncbi:MAG: NAD-dependent epimerase/dehydratase family protein [Candidatus Nitricoxidivorans perseverans]|uniref:NAD-dependent epimerase/dehydratase family protein n=1 Tax=Candidatus Nitricoxidivorans perseverans TaxID=2975601 RepID=A0AA49IYB6_9PROT|nr:MAG: NAD-dependent epimerase/dehydratase family protein [Candidatus Nitricoxidivorans perseverans]
MIDAIAVVGASGFVGRCLLEALPAFGAPVLALARREPSRPLPGVNAVVGRFESPGDFLPWLRRSRLVVHAASMSTPGSTAGNPLAELHGNLAPTLALLEALQAAPECGLLYLSSGGTLYGDTGPTPASEQGALRPKSYHGAGKAAAEHFIRAWSSQFGGRAVILRPSNLYGPGQTLRNGFGIVPTAFEKILRREPLTIWGDGSSIRDYLYIGDFIDLCLSVIRAPMPAGAEPLNAASGRGVSLNDLLREIETVTGGTLIRKYDATRPGDVGRVVLDNRKAQRIYGWRPATTLAEGLARSWDWYASSRA